MLAFTKSRKILKEQIKANSDTSIDVEAQRKRLEGELATLEKRRRNDAIAIAIETEGYTPDLAERRKVLSAEITMTKERIAKVDTPSQTVSPAAAARVIYERFSSSRVLRIEGRKKLLAETVEGVVVQSDDGDEIAMLFKVQAGIK